MQRPEIDPDEFDLGGPQPEGRAAHRLSFVFPLADLLDRWLPSVLMIGGLVWVVVTAVSWVPRLPHPTLAPRLEAANAGQASRRVHPGGDAGGPVSGCHHPHRSGRQLAAGKSLHYSLPPNATLRAMGALPCRFPLGSSSG